MNKKESLIHDMTSGSVLKLIIAFSAPLFFSNTLQAVYNMVDMIIVGRVLGENGLSAVSVGGDLLSCLQFVAIGISSAGAVQIAQLVGMGDRERLSRLIGTIFSSLVLCALVMTTTCLLLQNHILSWLNTPPEAREFAADYATTCTVGLIFIYGYNAVSAILRGMGDSKHPFIFVSIAAILNVVLDVLFVIVLDWQVFGAAFATVLAQGISFLCSMTYLVIHRRQFGFDFKWKSFAIHKDVFIPLVKLGIPMAIQTASVQFSKLFVSSWVNSAGVVVSAVSGIANKISSVCNLCATAISTAAAMMVGQNIGARKPERVTQTLKVTYALGLAISGFLSAVILLFPRSVFGIFTGDAEILRVCMEFLPCAVLTFLGQGLRGPNSALINGSGNSTLNFIVAIFDSIVVRIGVSFLLGVSLKMGYVGFWYGNAFAGFVPVLLGSIYYKSGRWKTRTIMKA